ncbi:MAG: 4a-hydroxytetrahydrobiopterin dehydratase [Acidobacteriota bacterium]
MSINVSPPSVSPSPTVATRLKAERIQLRLQSMGWNISTNRRLLSRQFQFSTQKEAIAFLNLALAVAENAQAPARRLPAFLVRGTAVRMTISAHGAVLAANEIALARSVSLLG